MGSDESHFNVSVGSDGQSRKTVSTNRFLFEEKAGRAEAISNRGPSAYQPNTLPLGQTGSHGSECRDELIFTGTRHPSPISKHWFTTSFLRPLPYLVTS